MTSATFSDILLGGLAPDGGLTLPESYPTVTLGELVSEAPLLLPATGFRPSQSFC